MKDKLPKMKTGRFTSEDLKNYPLLGEVFGMRFPIRGEQGTEYVPFGSLEKAIGRGGFGEVYRLDMDTRHEYAPHLAVKILMKEEDEEVVKRFRREGKIGYHHTPNAGETFPESLIKVYLFGQVPIYAKGATPEEINDARKYWAIWMEYIPGAINLSSFVDTEPTEGVKLATRLPFEEAIVAIDDLVEAIAYSHEKGMVHRDIKPENLLRVPGQRRVKLIDYGLGKMIGVDDKDMYGIPVERMSEDKITESGREGAFFGTIHYSAPESFGSTTFEKYPFEIDVWQVCATAYALLAGRPPHVGALKNREQRIALLNAIATEEAPFLKKVVPEVPWPINNWCMRGLEIDVNLRLKYDKLKFKWKEALKKSGVKVKNES